MSKQLNFDGWEDLLGHNQVPEWGSSNPEKWLELFGSAHQKMVVAFWGFHQRNGDVFQAFKAKAAELWNKGMRKSSGWHIINVIRWSNRESISNDYIALYSRLLVFEDEKFDGFFDFKQMNPSRAFDAFNHKEQVAL